MAVLQHEHVVGGKPDARHRFTRHNLFIPMYGTYTHAEREIEKEREIHKNIEIESQKEVHTSTERYRYR